MSIYQHYSVPSKEKFPVAEFDAIVKEMELKLASIDNIGILPYNLRKELTESELETMLKNIDINNDNLVYIVGVYKDILNKFKSLKRK